MTAVVDLTCLRCRKYFPVAAVLGGSVVRRPEDCRCVKPRPSADGKNLLGFPEGYDWRKDEYHLALAVGLAHRSVAGAKP